MDSQRFDERYGPWAVVAGASEGLGAAFASELASRKLDLVLVARRPEFLEATAGEVRQRHGVRVRTVAADLGSQAGVAAIRRETAGLAVGLLVYNAAASYTGPFLAMEPGQGDEIVDVNCRGLLQLCSHYTPAMVERGRGGILIMTSAAGLAGAGYGAVYSASKAFDLALGEALFQELAPQHVDVLTYISGAINTPHMKRMGLDVQRLRDFGTPVREPEEVALEAVDQLGRAAVWIAGKGHSKVADLLEKATRADLSERFTRANLFSAGVRPSADAPVK